MHYLSCAYLVLFNLFIIYILIYFIMC